MFGLKKLFDRTDTEPVICDEYSEFKPANLPDPGPFLQNQIILTNDTHVKFHRITKQIFEAKELYDMSFGYNLARLNLDRRHPDAGYRYAEESDDQRVLRVEFTPKTQFCPQTNTISSGSFRAWNSMSKYHPYDLIRIRVSDIHYHADEINESLRQQEERYKERWNPLGERGSDEGNPQQRSESPF